MKHCTAGTMPSVTKEQIQGSAGSSLFTHQFHELRRAETGWT